jgi:hypothetical protein
MLVHDLLKHEKQMVLDDFRVRLDASSFGETPLAINLIGIIDD